MQIKRYRSRIIQANCYLVGDGGKWVVIDPSVDYNEVLPATPDALVGIFITHGHFDHIFALSSYLDGCDAPLFLHEKAFSKLKDPSLNCAQLFSLKTSFTVNKSRAVFVGDTSELMLLSTPIRVIETPGHTDCSISILIADMLFTGDILFKNSIGRTDLPGAVPRALNDSFYKLKGLNPTLTVYPGHGDATVLGREMAENPYIPR